MRSRLLPEGIVDNFVQVIGPEVMAMTANTGLLNVALDYHLPITTYLTLITTLRNSVQTMVSPGAASRDISIWDDGLVGIR